MVESYLRYKYTGNYEYRGFDYVNYKDDSFSLETIEEDGRIMTIYKCAGAQTKFIDDSDPLNMYLLKDHKLPFYKHHLISRAESKALKVSKDKITVKVNDVINVNIELENGESAVEYPECIAIYDADRRKIKDIRIIKNGIVLTALCGEAQSEIMVFDYTGNLIKHLTLSTFTYPKVLNKSFFEPLTQLPRIVNTGNGIIALTYDDFGLIKKDTPLNTTYQITEYDGKKVITSIHPLYYDNFDYENYFNGYAKGKWVNEKITLFNNETEDIEYVRKIYDERKDVIS